jgi:hypothetical protein
VWQFRLANTNDAKLLDAHKDEHGVRVHRILSGGRRGGGGWRRVEEDAARAAEEEDANGSEHVGRAIDLVSRVLSFEELAGDAILEKGTSLTSAAAEIELAGEGLGLLVIKRPCRYPPSCVLVVSDGGGIRW